jgi:2-methylcitrate dehydratase PrpD
MPKALGVENLRRMGIANHGIGPVFGVGVAAASLMGLSRERVADLISYCSQLASGSWQWLLDIEHIEKAYVFAGMGAQNGLQAALLVEAGFTGAANNLDHPGGWMNSYMFTAPGSDHDRSYLIRDLGKRFELPLVAYKRYPVGGPTQPAVHALLGLAQKVDRRQVRQVKIEMPGLHVEAFRDAAMPALSLPYLASIILIDGKLDFDMVDSRARFSTDTEVRAMMRKIEVLHDPKQTHKPGTPRTESARVTVSMRSGERHEVFVGHVPGYPSHPMSRADVDEKALGLMAPKLGTKRARAVVKCVANIEALKKAGKLAAMIAA